MQSAKQEASEPRNASDDRLVKVSFWLLTFSGPGILQRSDAVWCLVWHSGRVGAWRRGHGFYSYSPHCRVWPCVSHLEIQICVTKSPGGGHLVSWPRVVGVWPSRGLLVYIMFSCLGLLSCFGSCIFCVVWFCLLVRFKPSDWLGRLTIVISFVMKGPPKKDQIEELYIVMVLLCVFPTCSTVSFLINLLLKLQYTIQRHNRLFVLDIEYFCWKCH